MDYATSRRFSTDLDVMAIEPGIFNAYKPKQCVVFTEAGCAADGGLITVTTGVPQLVFVEARMVVVISSDSWPIWRVSTPNIIVGPISAGLLADDLNVPPVVVGNPVDIQVVTYSAFAKLAADDLMRRLGFDPDLQTDRERVTPGAGCREWSALDTLHRVYRAMASVATKATPDGNQDELLAIAARYQLEAQRALATMQLTYTDVDGTSQTIMPGHVQLRRI